VARLGGLCEFKRSANDGFIEFSWIEAGDRQCLQRRDPWADSTLSALGLWEAADRRLAFSCTGR
jgi:hypothetical protein